MTPLQRGVHNLALALHMTVAQLTENMTMEEFVRWQWFFEERELERTREHNRAHGIVDFSDPQAAQQLVAMVHSTGAR